MVATTHVDYWAVGSTNPTSVRFRRADVSAQVTADWQPNLPPSASASFAGWPPYLLEDCEVTGILNLAMRREAGRSDRQWKSVLSWMLGVAGTRHVIAREGYKWIAPLSAFYPHAALPVDPGKWNTEFPKTALEIDSDPSVKSRLRPDYVALKGKPGAYPTGALAFLCVVLVLAALYGPLWCGLPMGSAAVDARLFLQGWR